MLASLKDEYLSVTSNPNNPALLAYISPLAHIPGI